MPILSLIIGLFTNIAVGYLLAVLLTGRIVSAKSSGIYSRIKSDFYRMHHYKLGLILVAFGIIYLVTTLFLISSLALSGVTIIGLGIGIFIHDMRDFFDKVTGKEYGHKEDRGITRKVKIYG